MSLFKKKLNKRKLTVYSLSILIHGILLLILMIVEVNYSPTKNGKSILYIVNTIPPKPKKIEKNKSVPIKKRIYHEREKRPVKTNTQKNEEIVKAPVDTITSKKSIKVPKSVLSDTSEERLKFAASLLDTFLVLHPEYAQFILKQQSKRMMKNEHDKMLTRFEIEKRINEELDKYLEEHYPEGSEHAMSKIGGKGMQIPIDGLIDAIRNIFK